MEISGFASRQQPGTSEVRLLIVFGRSRAVISISPLGVRPGPVNESAAAARSGRLIPAQFNISSTKIRRRPRATFGQ